MKCWGVEVDQFAMAEKYVDYFPQYIKRCIDIELLDEKLGQYDLKRLGAAIDSTRDLQFGYLDCRRCMTAIS